LLPCLTVAIVFPLALFSSSIRAHFEGVLTPGLQSAFLASVVLFAVHQSEGFCSREHDEGERQGVFVTFVPGFVVLLAMAFLGFLGPPWHLIILTVWLALGVQELHHLGKSFARGVAHPGVVTSFFFVVVTCCGLFPLWHDAVLGARGAGFYGFYAALPLVVLAFWLEERRWLRAGPRAPSARERPLASPAQPPPRASPVASPAFPAGRGATR
jgi:hypothetical protein